MLVGTRTYLVYYSVRSLSSNIRAMYDVTGFNLETSIVLLK